MDETDAERLLRLRNDIAYALGRGELPRDTFREFRFRWITTPEAQKSNLEFTLKDVEDFYRKMEMELQAISGQPLTRKIERRQPTLCGGDSLDPWCY